jgi:glucosyl-dolichyl phosphate glucuronosyltransferase
VGRLAVIVATRDRAAPLGRMLATALAMTEPVGTALELLVADDGSTDRTPAVVAQAAARHDGVRYLRADGGGKTRALNQAIRETTAPVLAFVDDDVELDRGWLAAATAYFADTDAAAAQGPIRLPPAVAADAGLVAEVARWGTIPCRDFGPDTEESRSLTGANMFVTRAAFAEVGLFDERLGPGAAGACEDTELALRLRAAGLRIGYVPTAVVYHVVEPHRLTAEYFRRMHELRGRSRVYYKRHASALSILPDLGIAALGVASTALAGDPRTRTRALGRWYHYRAMLRARRAPRLPGGAPRLEEPRHGSPPA